MHILVFVNTEATRRYLQQPLVEVRRQSEDFLSSVQQTEQQRPSLAQRRPHGLVHSFLLPLFAPLLQTFIRPPPLFRLTTLVHRCQHFLLVFLEEAHNFTKAADAA